VSVSDAPTRGLGAVETYMPTPWLVDPIEYVPELMWPVSIYTYAKMRRDPTVKSVLNAYMLPVLSAPWHVDPRGASETVTRIVADSLGLPVLGDTTEPADGPVNTRWVRWGDHLRAALGDLIYGFMPFEPVYDTSSGTAYLAGLPERMPWSITEIDVDSATGQLQGVRQARAGQSDVTIPADRLLYYVHQREGANWAGTSLLREAFGPWLFKADAMRGQARTLRRFGSAVPVMEPLPGFNPTPAQISEASRLAQAYRGDGDRAGAATPGFRLRLVGVEGAMPDHIPWMRYCDEQIARATLTSVLDLGSTNYGSRALGTVFLELMVQALQTVGEDHAVTASKLARTLTDYNEGPDAEAPIIVVGDVASSRQTLASTVATLVQAGALTIDSALESWVRDAFDLPANTGKPPLSTPAPTSPSADSATAPGGGAGGTGAGVGAVPGATTPAAPTTAAPPLSAAQGSPQRLGVATQEQWPYRRPLTVVEAAAGVDPLALDDDLEALVTRFVDRWPELAAAQHDALLAAVEQAVNAGDLTLLAGYLPPYEDVAAALSDAMLDAFDTGVTTARNEARAQGVRVPDPGAPDETTLNPMAVAAAASMAASLAAGAMREAMRLGGDGRRPASDVAAGVGTYLAGLTTSFVRDVAAGVFSDGVGAGRSAVMDSAGVPARYFASEVRDANTCPACLEIDGTEFGSLDEAEAAYPTGGYTDCAGGLRCRGIIFARYGEDDTQP
jgi:hypothetical protein